MLFIYSFMLTYCHLIYFYVNDNVASSNSENIVYFCFENKNVFLKIVYCQILMSDRSWRTDLQLGEKFLGKIFLGRPKWKHPLAQWYHLGCRKYLWHIVGTIVPPWVASRRVTVGGGLVLKLTYKRNRMAVCI